MRQDMEIVDKGLRAIGYRGKLTTFGFTKDEIGKAHGVPLAKLIKVENNFALCPFHSEKHNSLHITKNLYYCLGCGAGGDAIDFVQQTKFLFFKEAVKYLNVI